MTESRQFRVRSRGELLPYLSSRPIGLSHKRAKALLRFGAVTVQSKARVRHDTELEPGDVVTIAKRKHWRDAALERSGLRIVHLDDSVVVVDKPAGLLSMGSEREKGITAHRILNEHLKKLEQTQRKQALLLHRLRPDDPRLILLAKN